jgi:hypothetical protein
MLGSHYIAVSLPENTGFTWTLVSRLGAMLHEIEGLYGRRDMSWTPIGVEFGPETPQLWFPGNCKNIAIQLAPNARWDNVLACYQLAHECVHLLAPDGRDGAPVLEEGLATVYSEDYIARNFNRAGLTNFQSYADAATKVRQLLALNPDAIKALRQIEPCFKQMTASTFVAAGLHTAPESLVNDLLTPFYRT